MERTALMSKKRKLQKASRALATKYSRRRVGPSPFLGRLGSAYVKPSATTLALAPGPFSGRKYVTMLYENELTAVGGATNLLVCSTMPNSLYDYDKTGGSYFGNKQPLYYDNLLGAFGPYKAYRVISWKTTYTILNNTATCPVTVWAIPPVAAAAEVDSASEADNMPGVKRVYLTGFSGSKSLGTITVRGHIDDVYPNHPKDSSMCGSFNGDPSLPVYGGLIIHGSDGTTAPNVYVAVKHEAYCELQQVDALAS